MRVLQGDTFVVSDSHGDILGTQGRVQGLFHRDMRHLSRWQLRLNGAPLDVLSSSLVEYDQAVFFLVEPGTAVFRDPALSLIRRREVAAGMIETITVDNNSDRSRALELSMLYDCDFADLFEVKERRGVVKQGAGYWHRGDGGAVAGYRRESYSRETYIDAPGAYFTAESLTFRTELEAGQRWSCRIDISVGTVTGQRTPRRVHRPQMPIPLEEWQAQAPTLDTDWCDLRRIYERSLVDLAALRFYPHGEREAYSLPAAGLPWFMALFGRDCLISSYQALPFVPELARTTLHALANHQATDDDPFRDAQPGKILHELRHGELTYFGERPQSPYFGSADSTPLFLILLDEYERWSADTETVRALEKPARAALRWLHDFGDLDGDGFQEYRTRNPESGLANQCWKDSWNAIVHPDGRLAKLPRATCELQGYAYDAQLRAARLAREVWHDEELAGQLEQAAHLLRARFNDDFWLPEQEYYVLARDGDDRPVTTLASNMGHLLWSGILPPERAERVVAHLCGERMFSGWGVRTLATGQGAYNPVGYHIGTVWPHDTAIIAEGMARYGFTDQATTLASAMLEAAAHEGGRLPEALAGYPRTETGVPVWYPTACSPQAWASGAPLQLLRVLLGMRPGEHGPVSEAHLPREARRLRLLGVPWRGETCDIG